MLRGNIAAKCKSGLIGRTGLEECSEVAVACRVVVVVVVVVVMMICWPTRFMPQAQAMCCCVHGMCCCVAEPIGARGTASSEM
jgi:hypothetical protein